MTTYKKPKDVTYTEMCIYIDENIYKEKFDENLIYEYLYHIMVMLARNSYYFKTQEQYDYFGIYAATRLYMRLTDPRQFEENSKLQKVKSVLNFAKSILYPLKVTFQKEFFFQEVQQEENEKGYYNFQDRVSEVLYDLEKVEFSTYLMDIDKTIRNHIKNTQFYNDKKVWKNLYLSCLLTFLSMITLDKTSKKYLSNRCKNNLYIYKATKRLFERQKENCVILYNLDNEFHDYVFVLVNEVFHQITNDLSDCVSTEIPTQVSLKNLLLSQVEEEYI